MVFSQEKILPAGITVELAGTGKVYLPEGSKAIDLLSYAQTEKLPPLGVRINNVIRDLNYPLENGCCVEWINYNSEDGRRIYARSLITVLARAASEVLPGCSVIVKHTLGNGIYGHIQLGRALRERDIHLIEERMRGIVESEEPIIRKRVLKEEAIRLFKETNQIEKAELLQYHRSPEVDIYTCGWYHDFSGIPLVTHTGLLKVFRLRFYLPGFILEMPRDNPEVIPEYVEQGKLAHIYFEADKWGKVLGVRNVSSLNKIIINNNADELIRVAEAFHEKKISQIADIIASNIDRIRLVLIAGPSSSGKTTFAQRLATQLRVNGIHPVPLSLDNYFVDREKTPRDENGRYDFESLDAIDRSLFNDHLTKLIQGEEVELPFFNFKTGRREFRGETLRLKETDLIIIEGIHGLNDKLTSSIPLSRKFKIYVSALTQLNLDTHNRIPTTDLRIIRRIVRDNRCRGHSARETINMWPMVRRGEEKHIFPFQESADVMFNSALVYELAVLKKYIEPLLAEIPPDCPEYSEARRLLDFLSYFIPLDDSAVPANSIIREFIGNSCYNVE
ncbi:uridine kinase [Desulfofundulus australicus DSM 11792]|uniref:Uridine kinase n=1 Tax=Desulfofundulus australicus DSM 11792 TaxID=1121425 RepID=A0A1M5DBX8_9FIRM|nr:nucleoside kinase [Desulfofundulus australicus]SHF64364.1 uridine kinase [Desulfofundulus australicus DSM 11792]